MNDENECWAVNPANYEESSRIPVFERLPSKLAHLEYMATFTDAAAAGDYFDAPDARGPVVR